MEKSITKLKMLKIWEILSQETDEDNPMESTTLLKKLDGLAGLDVLELDDLHDFAVHLESFAVSEFTGGNSCHNDSPPLVRIYALFF